MIGLCLFVSTTTHCADAKTLSGQKTSDWAPLPKTSPDYDPDEEFPPAAQFANLHAPKVEILYSSQDGYRTTPDYQSVTFTFTGKLRNMSCRQIGEVDFVLAVEDKKTNRELFRSKPVAFKSFRSLNIPHVGALVPYAIQNTGEVGKYTVPNHLWRTDTMLELKVTKVVGVPEGGDLHDLGNLGEYIVNHHTADVERAILRDPSIVHDVNSEGTTTSLLVMAYGTPRLAKFVLSHGGNIKEKAKKGEDALFFAAAGNSPKMLDFVLHKGFKVDPPSCFPFRRAVTLHATRSVDWLMAHGVNLNRPDLEGWTPIAMAVSFRYPDIVDKLLRAKVNVHCYTNRGYGLMHLGIYHTEMLSRLVSAGLSVDDPMPRTRRTPLMMAVWSGDFIQAKWLLDHGAKLYAKDSQGQNVFAYARAGNTLHTEKFFRQAIGDLRKYGGT